MPKRKPKKNKLRLWMRLRRQQMRLKRNQKK